MWEPNQRYPDPNVQVLGALLNRTHGPEPSLWERDLWSATLTQCQNVWKSPIYSFQTSVRQMTAVRDLENEFARPEPGSELHIVFSNGKSQDITLVDGAKTQQFSINGAQGITGMTIQIMSTYSSTSGKAVALGDVEFFGSQ